MGHTDGKNKPQYLVDGKTFYSQAAADAYAEKVKSRRAGGPSPARFGVIVFLAGLVAYWAWPSPSFWGSEAAARMLSVGVTGGALGAFVVLILSLSTGGRTAFKRLREKLKRQTQTEDLGYLLALEEVESGSLDKVTWARALAETNGDLNAARAAYIRSRARQIANAGAKD